MSYPILDDIERQHTTNEGRLPEMLVCWLKGEGYPPSWRRLIFSLDQAGEVTVADPIRRFAEPPPGEIILKLLCNVEICMQLYQHYCHEWFFQHLRSTISNAIFSSGKCSTLCALWKTKHTSALSSSMASYNNMHF